MDNTTIIILSLVIVATVATMVYVWVLFNKIKKIKVLNSRVEEIGSFIESGAMAFLKREYKVIIPFILGIAVLLTILGFIPSLQGAEGVGYKSAICFVIGATFSGMAGFIGMKIATKANTRTAQAAENEGMPSALRVAFSGGSVLGLSVVGLGLLGLTALFFGAFAIWGLSEAVHVVSGYSLGCSLIALFARVGGGIYTKAADVGADLVGKVEAGIPEDDPRNPAVIADNVGDNVGDIAGMGSDLCESYVGSIVSALSLGLVSVAQTGNIEAQQLSNVLFVIILAAIGVIASLISVVLIRSIKSNNPQKTLSFATYLGTGIVLVGALVLSLTYLHNIRAFFAVVCGLAAGIGVGFIAEIYTSGDFKQVKEIASQSQTGHATNIIAGFGSGMQSTALTIAVLAGGIVISYFVYGNFGIALAAVGMLSTAGITVSVDGYGPISDNAGGIAEMSKMDKHVREITDKLDSVGNTTAAVGKGFCIGSATFTALALFIAYSSASNLESISITSAPVIIGVLVGAMLPYLFSSLTIKSVGKAANKMIEEVRNQFKENPEILKGNANPNYAQCVDISTKAALKEMILPGLIAVASPILAALILGAEGLGGLLMGGLVSAIMLAVFMANAGGAWDNAKKYVEEGHFGGKGSETHKAAVTGDTVGDPFKDTAGPAMDILIKLMSVIALILAPVLASDGFQSLWELITNLMK